MGIDKYNEECRSIVMRYSQEWEKTVTRVGRWIDFRNDYKTLDPDFMESVWWVFKQLHIKGLVYRGFKVGGARLSLCLFQLPLMQFSTVLLSHVGRMQVMPYSTGCNTALSNFEAGLNYKVSHADVD